MDKAIKLYEEAANQNYLGSIQNLGIIYHQIKDYDKALKWLNKAADLGLPQANYFLMEMYLNGDGVKQDFGEGIRLAKLAADSGYYLASRIPSPKSCLTPSPFKYIELFSSKESLS
jgi:hypothetical protein